MPAPVCSTGPGGRWEAWTLVGMQVGLEAGRLCDRFQESTLSHLPPSPLLALLHLEHPALTPAGKWRERLLKKRHQPGSEGQSDEKAGWRGLDVEVAVGGLPSACRRQLPGGCGWGDTLIWSAF